MSNKRSPEIEAISDAIATWMKKHKDNVIFLGSLVAFNEDSDVEEELLIGYGAKKMITTSMKHLQALLAKEEDFVNWNKAYIKPSH